MKNFTTSKISKLIVSFLIVSCFLIFNADCFAQQNRWQDKTDELDYGSDNTWLYVGLGVLAAGAITYFIISSSSSDDDDSSNKSKKKKESGGFTFTNLDPNIVKMADSLLIKRQSEEK